jgi:16S rRNA (guanine966-N2)-methyltransferase
MRIVAGKWRGRGLETPRGQDTRPTADRVRQALFDMLVHRYGVEGRRVLDAFAGTGALGFEALSRGAAGATFFDRDAAAVALIQRNAAKLGATPTILRADATRPPRAAEACDLVFLDPPYGKGLLAASVPALLQAGWIAESALLVAEMGADAPEPAPAGADSLDARVHGTTRIELWQLRPTS